MTPVILGLMLAIPLAQWTASPAAGRGLQRMRLLMTPEETRPPEILQRANALAARTRERRTGAARSSGCLPIRRLLAAHRAMLPREAARKRGEVDATRVIALAKLDDCASLHEVDELLTRQEKMAVLLDTRGLDRLARLKRD